MHHLSFGSTNPIFQFGSLRFSLQVFTFENVYDLDEMCTSVTAKEDLIQVQCSGFTWAGGQQLCAGTAEVEITHTEGRFLAEIKVTHATEKIRCVKLILHDLPQGKIANLRVPFHQEQLQPIAQEGTLLRYPNGFEGLYTPLVVVANENHRYSWFRSLDEQVRPKTFTLLPHDGLCDVELIFEECARCFSHKISVPVWEIGFDDDYNAIMERQTKWIQNTYHLQKWEERKDVPDWAKEISLIANIHCEHWTGYVFNTYHDVISNMHQIAEHVDPRRVMVYLPGWEGRYYYNYGDYRPSERMGGGEGFRKLIQEAHKLGMRVMPMFMINGANPHLEGFPIWGASSLYYNPSGYPQVWGSCDWDSSRHYDHNCGFPMNPGAPLWQDHLVNQINGLIDEYGFDGVFLDLAAVYCNDRRFDTHQGAIDIASRIRQVHPEVLIAGEGWYDALSVAYPLTQPSLSQDGDCRWSDRPYPALFDTSNRCFAHLGTGDVSRGSTGVFEFGYNHMTQSVPLRKGIIPTITIVDKTLERAPEKAKEIFDLANRYTEQYLK